LLVGQDYVKETELDFIVGVPSFLVVDQDLNKLSVSSFRNWLETHNYAFEVTSYDENIAPDMHLNHRDIIAVVGGNNPDALSDSSFQDSLNTWLDGNRKLLIMAPAASPGLGSSAFAQNTLGIQYNNSTTNIILKGTAGDPLGLNGGFVFLEQGNYEMVDPVGGSIAAVKFNGTASGGIVYRQDADNNKIVFISFDPRYVKSNSPVSEDQIMASLINWLEAPLDISPAGENPLLSDYILLQNYPNPFNPETTIRFHVPSQGEQLELAVYNNLGQRVKNFNVKGLSAGWNDVIWDGRNSSGIPVSSGVYYVVLKSNRVQLNRKIVLVR
ncbi:MAG: T9SS C-terminal target domain-containing protein, partial [Calditrichaeota bacterium]